MQEFLLTRNGMSVVDNNTKSTNYFLILEPPTSMNNISRVLKDVMSTITYMPNINCLLVAVGVYDF